MHRTVYVALLSISFHVSIITHSTLAQSLTAMTYNVRYDNPADPFAWSDRKILIAEEVLFHEVDIVGFQEVLHHQFEDLKQQLTSYSSYGVGRDNGKTQGEYSPIFFRSDLFRLIDSGTFWLSENIKNAGSKSWDAALPRICSWVHLEEIQSKRKLLVLNTHFDHLGVLARTKSAALLVEFGKNFSKDLPLILLGDFNTESEEEAYQIIIEEWADSRSRSPMIYGNKTSYNNWMIQADEKIIDHIFISEHFGVKLVGILPAQFNGIFASDHYPVIAKLKWLIDNKNE